jgi:hypothetical protein
MRVREVIMKNRCVAHLAVLAAAPLIVNSPAAADTLWYSTDFESAIGPEWSVSTATSAAPFTRFLGRFSGTQSATLTIPAVPPPLLGGGSSTGGSSPGGAGGSGMPYLLLFDFYCIDSWDGYANMGPDRLVVFINDVSHFDYTFSNQHEYYSYPHPPTVGPDFLGFTAAFRDSIYRDIAIPFDPGAVSQITIRWYGEVLQGMSDESWGIDNVRVLHNPVPTPGSLALLALSGVVVARRRCRAAE